MEANKDHFLFTKENIVEKRAWIEQWKPLMKEKFKAGW